MIEVLDNRKGQYDLEIDSYGYGRWYAHNPKTHQIIAFKYKYQAIDVKEYPEQYNI